MFIVHCSLVIVIDRGKSSGTLSTGVSEPDRGGGCQSARGYHVRDDHQFMVCFTVDSG